MQSFEKQYLELVERAIHEGDPRMDRTGVGTRALFGETIRHNWSEGFPLITHRQLNPKQAIAEMYCFINGITNVDTMKQFGCNWWEANLQSFNQRKVAAATTNGARQHWERNRYLGPVYGAQWREWLNFNEETTDQLMWLLDEAERNPTSRRLLVTAWNPGQVDDMALPPCHYAWQIFIREDEYLDLKFEMRSVDIILGMPNDIIAYAFLQLGLCRSLGYKPGKLICSSADTHIYENHVEVAKEMLLTIEDRPAADWKFTDDAPISICNITPDKLQVVSIEQGPRFSFEMAV